jgi:chromate transport protein ChrA
LITAARIDGEGSCALLAEIQQGCLIWQHHQAEIIWTLLIVVTALAILAKKVALPYPVLLLLGGLVLGFVPGVRFEDTNLIDWLGID